MKKLLTMLSAATVALGLYAAYTPTGTSFEDGTIADEAFNISTTDDLGGSGYWGTNGAVTVSVKAYGTEEAIPRASTGYYPKQFEVVDTQDKYLSIQSSFGADNLVTRYVQPESSGNHASVTIDAQKGFYFDSLVKFTAFDTDPLETKVVENLDGAKIAVWLQTNEEDTQTNLYVHAGKFVGGVVQTNKYDCGLFNGADQWHRLTIKAIKNIYKSGDAVPGFVVFVDGVMKTFTGDKTLSGIDDSELSENYSGYYGAKGLFPSMVQGDDSEVDQITSVSFDGTGAVDDLVFTEDAPAFAATHDYAKITWNPDHFTSVTIGEGGENIATNGSYLVDLTADGSNVTVYVTYVTGKTGPDYVEIDFAEDQSPFAIEATDAAAVVVVNGQTNSCANAGAINAAVGAATADDDAVVTLYSDVGELDFTEVEHTYRIKIDLNGKTLSGITTIPGIWLVDSSDDKTGTIVGAVTSGGASLIEAGKFEGAASFVSGTVISNGVFSAENNTATGENGLNNFAKAGYEFVQDGDYLVLQEIQETPVAQIGDTKYTSLKAAVDAATAGQTVTVLADCEVTEPITFSVGIVVSNDYTISTKAAYTLRFANGNTPVTICGNGEIVWDAGAGSPLLVGNNEATAKQTNYGISGVYAGSLILNGGTIRTGAIGDGSGNMIKVESGSFVMNGGEVSGKPTRCIKADAEAGNTTATVVINGGVISNTVVTKYDGTPLQPVALNASAKNSGTASITVNGGQITGTISGNVTIPGASTAQFDRDQTAFCVADYKTVKTAQSGDWYVVTAKVYYTAISLNKATTSIETNLTETLTATFTPASAADDTYTWASSAPAIATVDQNGVVTAVAAGEATITVTATHDSSVTASCTVTVTATAPAPTPTPIEPGESSESYATQEAAAAAAANVEVGVPTAVASALSTEAQATYKAMFAPTVVEDGKGGYKVEVAMTAAAETATQTQADADAAEVVEDLTKANVTLTTTPGLYYSFEYGTSLGNMTEGARTMATSGTLNLARPTTENATSGFYKVLVNVTDK